MRRADSFPIPLPLGVAAAALLFACAVPGAASAAITLGQVSPAVNPPSCGVPGSYLQADAVTAPYEVPSPGGVITSWSHRGRSGSGGSGRLQIWRDAPGLFDFRLVGTSVVRDFNSVGLVDSFPTRASVSPGDQLGLRAVEADTGCIYGGASGDTVYVRPGGEPSFGDVSSFGVVGSDALVNVAAVLEPDADSDDFGDETQDGCPGQSGPDDGCPPPSSPPPDGGGPGEPAVPPAPPDLTLDARSKQKAKKLEVDVSCGEVDCSVDFAGKGKVPKASGAAVAAAKAKKFKLKPKGVEVAGGATETVRLKFKKNRKSVKKIKRLLKQGGKKARKRAKAVVKATTRGAGGTDTAKQKVRLK